MRVFHYLFILGVLIYDAVTFFNGNMGLGTYLMVNALCFLFGRDVGLNE